MDEHIIEMPDFWHHINLRKKELDLPAIDLPILFAEYNSERKVFHKFVGYITENNWLAYQTGRMKHISKTKSKLYWRELPSDPEINRD